MNTATPSPPLPADDQSVDVWRVPLEVAAAEVTACRELLSADELERADRFKFPEGRRRFAVARAALRKVLSHYSPRPPAEWRFTYGPHGKPGLAPKSSGANVQFNISHAHELAVIAVTSGREVGVDVEWLQRRTEFESLARRFFGRKERAAFQAADAARRGRVFFQIWTRKEAWLKARGEGITVALEQFDVLEQLRDASVPDGHGETRTDAIWRFAEFECPGDYIGAVVVSGSLTALRLRTAQPGGWETR